MYSRIFKISKFIVSTVLALAAVLSLVSCFGINLNSGYVPTADVSKELTTSKTTAPQTSNVTKPVTETVPPVPLPVPITTDDADTDPLPALPSENEIAAMIAKARDITDNSEEADVIRFFEPFLGNYHVYYTYNEDDDVSYSLINGSSATVRKDGSILYSTVVDGMLCEIEYSNGEYSLVSAYPDDGSPNNLFSDLDFDIDFFINAPFFVFPEFEDEMLTAVAEEDGIKYIFNDEYTKAAADILLDALGYTEEKKEVFFSDFTGKCTLASDINIHLDLNGIDSDSGNNIRILVDQYGPVGHGGNIKMRLDGVFPGEFGYTPTTVEYHFDYHNDENGQPEYAKFTCETSSDITNSFPELGLNIAYTTSYSYLFSLSTKSEPIFKLNYETCYIVLHEHSKDQSITEATAEIEYDYKGDLFMAYITGTDIEKSVTRGAISFDVSGLPAIPNDAIEAAREALNDPSFIGEDPLSDYTIIYEPDDVFE